MFRIDTYLRADEHFHFARKDLSARMPRVAHDHDYYEIFLVENGAAVHRVNHAREAVEKGDLVFMRASDRHALQADPHEGCRILNVMFRAETAEHLRRRYAADLAAPFFWADDGPMAVRLGGAEHRDLVARLLSLDAEPRSRVVIETFLLLVMTSGVGRAEPAGPQAPPWLLRARDALQRPEVFRNGAHGFVAAAGRSHEHVCRMSRQVFGKSPSALANQARMRHAAECLKVTDWPVSRVAAECGIENLSYFHKLFRGEFGASPGDYRRRQQGDPIQFGNARRG